MKKSIGILGGGLAGLSLAYFLDKEKYQITILEKERECAGLLKTFQHQDFYFDLGGHIIFSKNQAVLNFLLEMLGDNKVQRYRNNCIYYNGRYVKYPFENSLSQLKKSETFACLASYIFNKLKFKKPPENFGDFLYYHFGQAITEKYLWPYNQKIWNTNPLKMSVSWAKERLPQPPAFDVIKSALGVKTEGYKHQLYFYYPQAGGIQFIAEKLEEKVREQGVKVITDFNVKTARKNERYIVSSGQNQQEFDQLLIALPIHNFFKAWVDAPQEVNRALNRLTYNSLIMVGLGVKRDKLTDKFAVYFPDESLLFHRVCFNKYLSDSMCPPGCSSVQAEITANRGDGVYELSDEEVIQKVINGLAEKNVISKSEVISAKVARSEYAYMVPQLDYDGNKKIIYDYLNSQNLLTCGRFAEFEYLNMDAVVEHAQKLAEKLNAAA